MSYELIALGATFAVTFIGTWIKMTNEIVSMKSRLIALEKSEGEVQRVLERIQDTMIRLEKLLAKHGIE